MKPHEIHHGPYTVLTSPPNPTPIEKAPLTYLLLNTLTWSTYLIYTIHQALHILTLQRLSPTTLWSSWLSITAEFALSFQDLVVAFNLIIALVYTIAKGGGPRERYLLVGDEAPTIDVFITCCGEDVDVILDTVAAVAAQDYPAERLRVFVLDDGKDAKLQAAVERMNLENLKTPVNGGGGSGRGPEVNYCSRTVKPGTNSFFKSGNLQFGIEQSKKLGGNGGSEFIASLDADMIPVHTWLRRIAPQLLLHSDLALACPPQRYYNVPTTDLLGQRTECDLHFSVYEPLNDRVDAAMCTGSGFIVRRSALESIGGWPQIEAGEDFMCSSVLSDAGHKIAFINEDLQFGLAPDSMLAFIKQRIRWVDSGIVVHKHFNFYLPSLPSLTSLFATSMSSEKSSQEGSSEEKGKGKTCMQMTPIQRISGLLGALREYAPITNVLALLILPISLLPITQSHGTLTTSTLRESGSGLGVVKSLWLLSWALRKVNSYFLCRHVGMRQVWGLQSLDVWCAPYAFYRCLVSILPSSMTSMGFEVSGATKSPLNERSSLHRASLSRRLLTPSIALYTSYILYASLPFILHLYSVFSPSAENWLPGPAMKLLDCIAKSCVPIWYMISPPTVPERKELMEVDEYGIRGPKEVGEAEKTNWGVWEGVEIGIVAVLWYAL